MTTTLNSEDQTTSAVTTYPLAELCILADLPIRTVRYYVQNGLVDRPEGETRAARYGAKHLEQLLLIKKWTSSGVSLERIRELLHGAPPAVPPRTRPVGGVSVCSHLTVADGVEIVIDPGRAGLSPEQVRQFVQGVMQVFGQISSVDDDMAQVTEVTPNSASTEPTPRRSSRESEHGND